jgi:hypothetical protein
MTAQILSERTLRRMTRKFLLPFTFGWARGESYYRLHTANHTTYYVCFTGRRPGSRSYVLRGPVEGVCAQRRARLQLRGPCPLNDLRLMVNPHWPGELVGVPQ